MTLPRWLRILLDFRNTLIVLISPLILLPLPLVIPGKESACGYVIILMAVYWITECLPLAVTSLLPLILFPLLGVSKAAAVSVLYFKNTNWLLFGGLVIAIAVEVTKLHKRIALRVLLTFGAKPRWLMLGFMLTSFFLSMWISNTATTAMILPIVEAIFREIEESTVHDKEDPSVCVIENNGDISKNKASSEYKDETDREGKGNFAIVNEAYQDDDDSQVTSNQNATKSKQQQTIRDESFYRVWKGVTICIPYSSSIGGTATLTGTAPNLVLAGQFDELFPDATQSITFGTWFVYAFPQALVFLLIAYVWLSIWFIGFDIKEMFPCCFKRVAKSKDEHHTEKILKREYGKLGDMRWSEKSVLGVFIVTAILWFTRNPGFFPGWSEWFSAGYILDGTVAVTMAFTLFFLPSENPWIIRGLFYGDPDSTPKPVPPILTWKIVQEMFPWNVCFIMGAGFAIAGAATSSGLSTWVGTQLEFLGEIDRWLICLTITTLVCFFTECTSNTATAALFVPVIAQLSQVIEVHPFYLLIPPIIASSFAFMLPVATPPNAIAFSFGRIDVLDLVKAGWLMNIMGILVLTFFVNTVGIPYYNLNTFPEWAKLAGNESTSIMTTTSFMNTTST